MRNFKMKVRLDMEDLIEILSSEIHNFIPLNNAQTSQRFETD